MSDDHSQNNDSPSPKKGFFTLILNQLFHGEPKNRGDLVELIRDSEQNDLIDPDTRDMLEGDGYRRTARTGHHDTPLSDGHIKA